jgi:hypothetical protein
VQKRTREGLLNENRIPVITPAPSPSLISAPELVERTNGASVCHVAEDASCIVDNVVARVPLDVADEPYPAAVLLEVWVVQPLCFRQIVGPRNHFVEELFAFSLLVFQLFTCQTPNDRDRITGQWTHINRILDLGVYSVDHAS